MNGRDLYRAMSYVDPALAEEAAEAAPERWTRFWRRAAVTACVCATLAGTALAAEGIFGVRILDVLQGEAESSYRVLAEAGPVPADTFSSPALTEALEVIQRQYGTYQPWESTLPGSYRAEWDTWADCEAFLGIALANPLEGREGLSFLAPSGAEDEPHCDVSLYADEAGVLSWVTASALYQTEACRIQLSVEFVTEEGGRKPELHILYDGEAAFRTETRPLGSGGQAQVMTAWPEGARYSQQEAYFARDGGIWTLRVWRYAPAEPEEERMAPVAEAMEELLELF